MDQLGEEGQGSRQGSACNENLDQTGLAYLVFAVMSKLPDPDRAADEEETLFVLGASECTGPLQDDIDRASKELLNSEYESRVYCVIAKSARDAERLVAVHVSEHLQAQPYLILDIGFADEDIRAYLSERRVETTAGWVDPLGIRCILLRWDGFVLAELLGLYSCLCGANRADDG